MPKGSKTELPKLDEWKAPWEVDADGNDIPAEDQDIDPAKLKKYLHGLLGDKNRLRGQVDDLTAETEAFQQKLADAKTPEELTRLQEENARLVRERDEAKQKSSTSAEADLRALKLEIALDKGLTKRQAARLVGATKEELEEDADALIAEFGGSAKGSQNEGEEDGEGIARGPVKRLKNGGDPKENRGGGSEEQQQIDYAAVVKQALANR